MPNYSYKCKACNVVFSVLHGMMEQQENCIECYSKDIHKVPQMFQKQVQHFNQDKKVGDEVKKAIDENKAILKEEKKKRVELPE